MRCASVSRSSLSSSDLGSQDLSHADVATIDGSDQVDLTSRRLCIRIHAIGGWYDANSPRLHKRFYF